MSTISLPKNIQVVEVGPRDGFQNVTKWIPTEKKIEIIEQTILAGLKKIEVTSFVHPKAVPQMKDAKEVVETLREKHKDKLIISALVPNLFGAKNAFEAGVDEITYVISASEKHNMANVNKLPSESVDDLKLILKRFPDLKIKLAVATAFSCPFAGRTPVEKVLYLVDSVLEVSIEAIICLADTIGAANPLQTDELISRFRECFGEVELSLHLHDTQGMGLANTIVAMQRGINTFETSFGGLGGCPFAPGASGNIATEDLVNMAHQMGIETGIDMNALIEAVTLIKGNVEAPLASHISSIN